MHKYSSNPFLYNDDDEDDNENVELPGEAFNPFITKTEGIDNPFLNVEEDNEPSLGTNPFMVNEMSPEETYHETPKDPDMDIFDTNNNDTKKAVRNDLILSVTGALDQSSSRLLGNIPLTRTPSPVSMGDINSPDDLSDLETKHDDNLVNLFDEPAVIVQKPQTPPEPIKKPNMPPSRPPPPPRPPASPALRKKSETESVKKETEKPIFNVEAEKAPMEISSNILKSTPDNVYNIFEAPKQEEDSKTKDFVNIFDLKEDEPNSDQNISEQAFQETFVVSQNCEIDDFDAFEAKFDNVECTDYAMETDPFGTKDTWGYNNDLTNSNVGTNENFATNGFDADEPFDNYLIDDKETIAVISRKDSLLEDLPKKYVLQKYVLKNILIILFTNSNQPQYFNPFGGPDIQQEEPETAMKKEDLTLAFGKNF